IGTDATGLIDRGNGQGGIWIGSSAGTGNRIGTNADGFADAAERNVIAGNDGHGVVVQGSGNVLAGNLIGLGADGVTPLGNLGCGVMISNGANNVIGGASAAARNVISANASVGVFITGNSATGNQVSGNFIGLDAGGNLDRGNGTDGVVISNGAANNTVGG